MCCAGEGCGTDATAKEVARDGKLSLEQEASPVWAGLFAPPHTSGTTCCC